MGPAEVASTGLEGSVSTLCPGKRPNGFSALDVFSTPAIEVRNQSPGVGIHLARLEPAGNQENAGADGWLAWAVKGRFLRVASEDGLKPVGEMAGNHYALLVACVRPDTAVSPGVGYKRCQRLNTRFLAFGELCQVHADDFAEAETLLP